VLPVLQQEFGVTASQASLTVSAVILGIALANLPFGTLADRHPVRPLIMLGGLVVAACSLLCAATASLPLLVGARFIQGLFIPCLTTCVAAYLSRSLPLERLNVVMGSYVSATVAGGLSGRLLGGWIHPPLHWRYAFVSAAILVLAATLSAGRWLPQEEGGLAESVRPAGGFLELLGRRSLRRDFFVAFSGMFVFSSVFNYLPFYLAGPPFRASTHVITMMYLSYLVGVVAGPTAGRLSNRIGNGATMVLGAFIFALAISLTFFQSIFVIPLALSLVCAGFFSIHASAVGSLNRKLTHSRGQANSLYVLFYYLGGAAGITASGYAYNRAGWLGVGSLGILVLSLPLVMGLKERREGT
jgi:YNFM family putative membrane transporter